MSFYKNSGYDSEYFQIITANVTFFVSSFAQAVFEYFVYVSYIVGQGFMKGRGDETQEDITNVLRDEYDGIYEYSDGQI